MAKTNTTQQNSSPLCILGTGSALPDRVVTNAELESLTGVSERRIAKLFQITERRWSRGKNDSSPEASQLCSDLAARAAASALESAGLDAGEIDALVVSSITADYINPSLDYLVGSKLNLSEGLRFTVAAPCTGLFRSLVLAEALILAGRARRVLVVTAETISPLFSLSLSAPLDHRLSTTLYADGAGAIVVSGESENPAARISFVDTRTTASAEKPGIVFPGPMSAMPYGQPQNTDHPLGYHDFARVLSIGGKMAADALHEGVSRSGWTIDEVDLLLTHQATGHIPSVGAKHGLPADKIPTNIATVGNTISASILILLDQLVRAKTITAGTRLVAATAESSSWSMGTMALRWQ